jgi:hypothetical protein
MIRLIRLSTDEDFKRYSSVMQDFENQFDYPMDGVRFQIRHGNDKTNYFSFFKRLGDVSYFILKDNDKVVGAGTAILKEIIDNGKRIKYWYIGDFKITESHRGIGLLNKLAYKYFFYHYFQSNSAVAFNMSPIKNNGLINKFKFIFSLLGVKLSPFYFYEWNYEVFVKDILSQKIIKDNYFIFTNNNLKDVIIDGEFIPFYHLVDKEYGKNNYPGLVYEISDEYISNLSEKSTFLFGTVDLSEHNLLKNSNINHTSESSFLSRKVDTKDCHFFTGEI